MPEREVNIDTASMENLGPEFQSVRARTYFTAVTTLQGLANNPVFRASEINREKFIEVAKALKTLYETKE